MTHYSLQLFDKLTSLFNINLSTLANQLDREIREAKNKIEKKAPQKHSKLINWIKERNPIKRIPHGYVKQLVANTSPVYPWLTYNVMMNSHCRQAILSSIAADAIVI